MSQAQGTDLSLIWYVVRFTSDHKTIAVGASKFSIQLLKLSLKIETEKAVVC